MIATQYACFSYGPLDLFSFNILSRTNRWRAEDVDALVASAAATSDASDAFEVCVRKRRGRYGVGWASSTSHGAAYQGCAS